MWSSVVGGTVATSGSVVYTLALDREALTVTSISDELAGTLGYPVAEALSPNWWIDGLHPEDRTKVLAMWRSLLSEGHWMVVYRFRHKDGSYRWLRDDAQLRRDAAGRPIEVMGTWSDISEQQSR